MPGGSMELRDFVVRMIEEYARHSGHADYSGRIDGWTGQQPPIRHTADRRETVRRPAHPARAVRHIGRCPTCC
ncbi:MAG TPA: DUF664 domain-containing protein, partial [Phycicoccus sp.]|nr:DUF664 domain-containing protein [Phycicoccus sp.]